MSRTSAFTVVALMVIISAGCVLGWLTFLRPSPADVIAAYAPSRVQAGEPLKIQAVVNTRVSEDCLGSTQVFLRYADGTMLKFPGNRGGSKRGQQEVVYVAEVPHEAPLGQAQLFARDFYPCRGLEPVDTPKINLEVVKGNPNG